MRRWLAICATVIMPLFIIAQDFSSMFMDENKGDSCISNITISPRMMEEILSSDVEKNEEVMAIMTSLKSMQIVFSKTKGKHYFDNALKLANSKSKRYKEYLSYNSVEEDYHIMVRKKKDIIVEMVMIMLEDEGFTIINFTGDNIRAEYISTLANSMAHEHR